MKFTVKNQQTKVEGIEVGSIDRSSLVLIGDAEAITCSSIFDTPKSSVIMDPRIPYLGDQPPVLGENNR